MTLIGGLLAAATFSLFRQETRGTLPGPVTDQTGAVIPGVQVAVENQAGGIKSETATNQDGLSQVPYFLPGFYQGTASQPGFRTLVGAARHRDSDQ